MKRIFLLILALFFTAGTMNMTYARYNSFQYDPQKDRKLLKGQQFVRHYHVTNNSYYIERAIGYFKNLIQVRSQAQVHMNQLNRNLLAQAAQLELAKIYYNGIGFPGPFYNQANQLFDQIIQNTRSGKLCVQAKELKALLEFKKIGDGKPVNYAALERLLHDVARQTWFIDMQYNAKLRLADLYSESFNLPVKNPFKERYYLQDLARNHPAPYICYNSALQLAHGYYQGVGGQAPDYQTARYWLCYAADQNDVVVLKQQAEEKLALMDRLGLGI